MRNGRPDGWPDRCGRLCGGAALCWPRTWAFSSIVPFPSLPRPPARLRPSWRHAARRSRRQVRRTRSPVRRRPRRIRTPRRRSRPMRCVPAHRLRPRAPLPNKLRRRSRGRVRSTRPPPPRRPARTPSPRATQRGHRRQPPLRRRCRQRPPHAVLQSPPPEMRRHPCRHRSPLPRLHPPPYWRIAASLDDRHPRQQHGRQPPRTLSQLHRRRPGRSTLAALRRRPRLRIARSLYDLRYSRRHSRQSRRSRSRLRRRHQPWQWRLWLRLSASSPKHHCRRPRYRRSRHHPTRGPPVQSRCRRQCWRPSARIRRPEPARRRTPYHHTQRRR